MDIVLVSGKDENTTLMQVFNGYNTCIKLVFYSLILFVIFSRIQYVLSKKMDKQVLNKDLSYKIIEIFLEISSSMMFFCVFQGILSLYGHYISGKVFTVLFNLEILIAPLLLFLKYLGMYMKFLNI